MAGLALAIDIVAKDRASKTFDHIGGSSEKAGSKLAKIGPLAATAAAAVGTAILAAGAGLLKLGANFDEAYDKIRVGTGATGDALKGLEGDFKSVLKSVPTDFGSASTAIADLNTRLGLTGKPLQDLSKQFLEVSRITGTDLSANIDSGTAALNNFGIAAGEQPAALDQVFRAAQASGASFGDLTSELAKNGATFRAVGLDFAESTALLASLNKAGVETTDVIPALSRAMATAAKKGKDAKTVFSETFDAIKKAPTDTKAAGDAVEVFGTRAGPRLAALIREGKLSYEDMLKTVFDGSDTIMKASADTQDFAEKWTQIKNRVFVALEPVAMRLFDAVNRGMDWLSDAFDRLQPRLQSLVEQFRNGEGAGGRLQDAVQRIRDAFERNRPTLEAWGQALLKIGEFIATKVIPVLFDLWSHQIAQMINVMGATIRVAAQVGQAFIRMAEGALSAIGGMIGVLAKIPGPFQDTFRKAKDSIQGAKDELERANTALDRLAHPRTVNVTTVFRSVGTPSEAAASTAGGFIRARAAGGPISPGMPYWVGERGPELVVPTRAGTVIPARRSAAIAGTTGPVELSESSVQRLASAILTGASRVSHQAVMAGAQVREGWV